MLINKHYTYRCLDCGHVSEATHRQCSKCHSLAVKTIDRIGKCTCGRLVPFNHCTNTCDCGRDYNSSGQELAPRSQWGEETGESQLPDTLCVY
jgi:hypothetical protein